MHPRVLSLGMAFPEHKSTQRQAFKHFGWKSPLTRRIFDETGIDTRYSWIDPERFGEGLTWQDLCDEYEKGALSLGVAAAHDALDGRASDEIGLITFASVSGYTVPSMSYPIAGELGLRRNVVHSDLLGMGCEAAAPSLERARDYVVVHPNELALSLSVEVCSATWYPASEREIDYVVSSAIFGDGASSAVVGYSEDTRFPEIVDFESYYDPEYVDLLGYKWVDGRLKVVLSRRVPEIVPPLIGQTVDAMLSRNGLSRQDIKKWILHPGGKTVLENLEKVLGLTKEDTFWSWEVMRQYGNVSSATLGIIAKHVQLYDDPHGWAVAATMGAGTAVNTCLLHWD